MIFPDLYSYNGQSKIREDSRNAVLKEMPACEYETDPRKCSTPFLVYEHAGSDREDCGHCYCHALQTYEVEFPDHLATSDTIVLKMELGYVSLRSLGKGYALEAAMAMLDMHKQAPRH